MNLIWKAIWGFRRSQEQLLDTPMRWPRSRDPILPPRPGSLTHRASRSWPWNGVQIQEPVSPLEDLEPLVVSGRGGAHADAPLPLPAVRGSPATSLPGLPCCFRLRVTSLSVKRIKIFIEFFVVFPSPLKFVGELRTGVLFLISFLLRLTRSSLRTSMRTRVMLPDWTRIDIAVTNGAFVWYQRELVWVLNSIRRPLFWGWLALSPRRKTKVVLW